MEDALAIKNTDIVKELSLPPVKIHCSVLAEDAIRAAIGDWKKKNGVAEAAPVASEAAAAKFAVNCSRWHGISRTENVMGLRPGTTGEERP